MSRAALSAPGRVIRDEDIEFLHAPLSARPDGTPSRLPSLRDAERTHIALRARSRALEQEGGGPRARHQPRHALSQDRRSTASSPPRPAVAASRRRLIAHARPSPPRASLHHRRDRGRSRDPGRALPSVHFQNWLLFGALLVLSKRHRPSGRCRQSARPPVSYSSTSPAAAARAMRPRHRRHQRLEPMHVPPLQRRRPVRTRSGVAPSTAARRLASTLPRRRRCRRPGVAAALGRRRHPPIFRFNTRWLAPLALFVTTPTNGGQ